MVKEILRVERVTTSFLIQNQFYPAVDDVSFSVYENEIVAVVGESGCGKSALALSIMQLHHTNETKIEGVISYRNRNLVTMSESTLNQIRGKEIGMIFQEPMTALNPLMRVGRQIEETLDYHTDLSKKQKRARALDLLASVGIPYPKRTYKQYPHELSGGMRQRVVIAMAIACTPSLIIADEPTTALDVTIQAQIIAVLKDIQAKTNMGILFITHDLSVVAEIADRIIVMYAGQIVEIGTVDSIFKYPLHPYTRSLFRSIPTATTKKQRLHTIQGIVPSLFDIDRIGCRFQERIPWLPRKAHEQTPQLHDVGAGHFVRCTCYKHFYFSKEGVVKYT